MKNLIVKLILKKSIRKKPKNIKIDRMIFFNFDEYFNWPNLNNEFVSNKGFCYGLDSHFGILSSGIVVPCCLDKDGIINLGNTNTTPIKRYSKLKKSKRYTKWF